MSKALLWVGAIFFPVGLLFAGVSAFVLASDQELAENGARANGVVVALDRRSDSDGGSTYAPVVEWEDADGTRHEFTSSVSSNPASFDRGEAVTVMYDPAEPGGAKIDSFGQRFMLPLLFGGLGSVFALIGGGMIAFYWRRKRIIAYLKTRGLRIYAEFQSCQLDRSTKINGLSPYIVSAQAKHPLTGKLASFKSDPIWVDLSDDLAGQQVPVLVDPTKPKRHYIDLDQWVHDSEEA